MAVELTQALTEMSTRNINCDGPNYGTGSGMTLGNFRVLRKKEVQAS